MVEAKQIARRIGLFSLIAALALLLPSFALKCSAQAALVGGFSLGNGAVFGLALAAVTRTRSTLHIYLALLIAALSLYPLFSDYPPAFAGDIHLWPHAPDILLNYFDVLRPCLFLLGLPYPFARFGYHAPDVRSS